MEKTTKTSSDEMNLTIVTPSGVEFEGGISEGVFPGESGDFGILPFHTPFLSVLRIGLIKIKKIEESAFEVYATSGGYIEVQNNVITLLAETAEHRENIDKQRAQESLERAEERIKKSITKAGQDIDVARAESSLKRALNRLEAYKK